MCERITVFTMLCHITRPDSVVLEVEVDPKANGEDILNKVSAGNSHFKFKLNKVYVVKVI